MKPMGMVLGGILGTVGGILPDRIEPAINYNHRKFFHSKTIGIIIVTGVFVNALFNQNEYIDIALKSFCAGYLSHLGLDSLTPRGLPL